MSFRAFFKHRAFRPTLGATLTALCGLVLWGTVLGRWCINTSYDYLFRFGSQEVTNDVVVVLMDRNSVQQLKQDPAKLWDRSLHAALLDKLADDGCPLVVMEPFFRAAGDDPVVDANLEAAIRRQQRVVLMARLRLAQNSGQLHAVEADLPYSKFLAAAGLTNWGLGLLDTSDGIVRKHWPFPSPQGEPSLPWTAAVRAGANLSETPQKRWLRYYGKDGAWSRCSYRFAQSQPDGYFLNRIVFVGVEPLTAQVDSFDPYGGCSTPYTRWTDKETASVEVLATEFLNLVNKDWLRRTPPSVEALIFALVGILSGAGMCRLGLWGALMTTLGGMVFVTIVGLSMIHLGNFWTPWFVIVGGQLPCAWLCSLPHRTPAHEAVSVSVQGETTVREVLFTPDYQLVRKLGEGGFGEVWLARNAIAQWQALKVVYRKKFEEDRHYDYEFEGIKKYKPVSEKHPGLLRVEHISEKRREGFYYYVMELGDSLVPGWEADGRLYEPDTLTNRTQLTPKRRLEIADCARFGPALAEALHCLHESGLTHRDVKPQNVIFVNGRPKLADVGLVTHARTGSTEATRVGTPGYMPDDEPHGTVQADIYGLGMLLYVISTSRAPTSFPELSRSLLEHSKSAPFLRLNHVIVNACHPDRTRRFRTAVELRSALLEVLNYVDNG